jgi:drug/metabolite transporter (DMT)-like permease
MEHAFVIGVMFGILAALMLNIGKGIQKQKVHVFLQGRRMFAKGNRADLGIWILGLAITAGAALPYSLGLAYSKSPSTISAMTGVGLIGLLAYALWVIGEKIKILDGLGFGLVIVGTSLLAWSGAGSDHPARQFANHSLAVTIGIMLAVAALACFLAWRFKKFHGATFGLSAGLCIGVAIFLADAGLVRSGGSISGLLDTPYPLLALSFAVVAVIGTQLGFLRGRALEVVPAVNAATILTPLLLEIVIYGVFPSAFKFLLFGVILCGVFMLSGGTVGKVAA